MVILLIFYLCNVNKYLNIVKIIKLYKNIVMNVLMVVICKMENVVLMVLIMILIMIHVYNLH